MNNAAQESISGAVYKTFFSLLIILIPLLFISCSSEQKNTVQQSKYLTPDILCGTVQFSDGCSPKLDTLISFGIALIHHMTYEDAEHTFDQVIELDKDCFWGYWGKAMTYIHPLWPDVMDAATVEKGYKISQNALSLAKTKKEKLYGAAVAAFYENELHTKPERLEAFRNGWMTARTELPDDIEARMFSVLTMLATVSPMDKSYKVQREAGQTAESVLQIIPDHPAGFHYAIHAYDVPQLSNSAIRVAKNYYKIAPEIPHALHMPTHIFTRLGLWNESIELNSRSAAAAWRLPVGDQISGHYFHALDYLAYAYLQISELDKAKNIAGILDTLGGTYQPVAATAYCLAAVHGRILLEYQKWDEAANLQLNNHSNFQWNKFPQYEALIYYANGIGAGRSKNTEKVKDALDKLDGLQKTFTDVESNKYWINQIEIQKKVVQAWELYAQNEMEKSLKLMTEVANLEDATEKNPVTPGQLLPVREMLADLLLEMNRPKDALKQYELTLEKNPYRFNSLYGAGKSAELIGDDKKAKNYFGELLKTSGSSKSNRERLTHAINVTAHI